MNDFLNKLRTGGNKRFDRNRRPFENPPFRIPDRQNGRDRKNPQHRKNYDGSQLQTLKKSLETLVDGQKQMIEQVQRLCLATERIVKVLERGGSLPVVTDDTPPPEPEPIEAAAQAELSSPSPPPEAPAEAPQPATREREALLGLMTEKRKAGESLEQIADYLASEKIPTLSGRGQWRAQSVSRFLNQYARTEA